MRKSSLFKKEKDAAVDVKFHEITLEILCLILQWNLEKGERQGEEYSGLNSSSVPGTVLGAFMYDLR